jgi:hypothetical protein
MNILQSLPVSKFGNILVTLNPPHPPSPSLTQATYEYKHPLYNAKMVAGQEELSKINGKEGIWYAGAWTGYGFHEDGFASGMRVGLELGGSVPWEPKNAKFSRGVKPTLGWKDYVVRLIVVVLQLWIRLLERFAGVQRQKTIGARQNGNGLLNGKAKKL